MKRSTPGYLLIMALMMLSLATVLVTLMVTRGLIFVPYMDSSVKREQAKQLALGGAFIAAAQLAKMPEPTEPDENQQQKKQKKSADQEEAEFFLETFLPTLNQWQEVKLTAAHDGVDGTIKLCIMSEEGKINLNQIYDFQKHAFIGEQKKKEPKQGAQAQQNGEPNWKEIMQDVCTRIEKQIGGDRLFPALENFLTNRKQPLRDVTELLRINEFSVFRDAIFYEPPEAVTAPKQPQLFLVDLFCVSGTRELDPWLFSPSIRALYGLEWRMPSDPQEQDKRIDEALKKYKVNESWKAQWDKTLKVLYGKELQSLPKYIESLLQTQFQPISFSVLVKGTVGEVTQRLLVFVSRYEIERKQTKKGTRIRYDVAIEKLCWL